MFIDKNSIIVNGISFGQYLVEVEYEYNKLWGEDSGRNLAGDQSGTLLGIFPKLIMHFRRLTKSELELLAPIFDSATQSVTYYDPNKQTSVTMQTYTGNWKITNRHLVDDNRKNENFQISFIPKKKRV